ncbi:MAG: hypothetical protein C0518_02690 [Opitutus sp.]|nr:hypothetical protein [Opitutus sp.]
MKNRNTSETTTPSDLLSDLRSLVVEAEQMMESSGTEYSADAVDALRARYEAVQERLGVMYASAKKNVVAGAKCTDEAIRSHPYQAIAIAAGVGLLAGVLIGRRSQ